MNKERRKELNAITEELSALKERLENVASEERDAKESLPDSLQEGDRGQAMEAAADSIESAANSIDEVVSSIEEAIQ